MKQLIIILLFISVYVFGQNQIVLVNNIINNPNVSHLSGVVLYFFNNIIPAESPAPSLTEQNLILRSQEIDHATWQVFGSISITADQANDGLGNSTLEECTMSAIQTFIFQDISSNISDNTEYTISFEVLGTVCNVLQIIAEDAGDNSTMELTPNGEYTAYFGSSLTGSLQVFSYTFTTENPMAGDLRIDITNDDGTCNGESFYIGRVWLTEGDADFRLATWQYVVTTDTQITGD